MSEIIWKNIAVGQLEWCEAVVGFYVLRITRGYYDNSQPPPKYTVTVEYLGSNSMEVAAYRSSMDEAKKWAENILAAIDPVTKLY